MLRGYIMAVFAYREWVHNKAAQLPEYAKVSEVIKVQDIRALQ